VLVWYCFSPQYLCRDKGCTHKEKGTQTLGERWDPAPLGGGVADDLKQILCYHAKFGSSATKGVRGAPAQPIFGSSPQFMCTPFDAELPNLNSYWPNMSSFIYALHGMRRLKTEIHCSRTPRPCACLVLCCFSPCSSRVISVPRCHQPCTDPTPRPLAWHLPYRPAGDAVERGSVVVHCRLTSTSIRHRLYRNIHTGRSVMTRCKGQIYY